ncbi:MAG: substrate-binding domain-containing protein [Oscillospiraceae bacterium]|nr:substrate-binding domain-containing protein [Oscillospiraceae bacterium]
MNFDLFDAFDMLGYGFLVFVLTAAIIGAVVLIAWMIGRKKAPSLRRKVIAMCVAVVLLVTALGIHHTVWVSELSRRPYMWDDMQNYRETHYFWRQFHPFGHNTRTITADFEPDMVITEDWPRLDGSTALLPVYSAIAETIYLFYSLDDIPVRGGDYIQMSTTRGAFENLTHGHTDIIFTLQPSQEQVEFARRHGVEFIKTPIAREAFVFFVHENNLVECLTIEQIRQIYSGDITNWRDVGGHNRQIAAYQRESNSGSQTAMEEVVMAGLTMIEPESHLRAMGMGMMLRSVAEYTNHERALGYSFRFYATVMNPQEGLRLLAIDGIEPTPENIADSSYPLTGNVYAITTTRGLENPNTQKVLDWLVSPQGQRLIELAGYVGLG